MRIPQQGVAELILESLQRLCYCIVIRLPVSDDARLLFILVYCLSVLINILSRESFERTQAGRNLVLVQRFVIRRTIQIDDVS